MFNKLKKVALAAIAMGAGTGVANAAVPDEATAALGGVLTDGLALIGQGWPVIAGIVTAFVLFKVFKRVVSAST